MPLLVALRVAHPVHQRPTRDVKGHELLARPPERVVAQVQPGRMPDRRRREAAPRDLTRLARPVGARNVLAYHGVNPIGTDE